MSSVSYHPVASLRSTPYSKTHHLALSKLAIFPFPRLFFLYNHVLGPILKFGLGLFALYPVLFTSVNPRTLLLLAVVPTSSPIPANYPPNR